jgi:hypothetical protein
MTPPDKWPDPPLVPPRRLFFESHIRPMFRHIDVDHMLFKVSPSKSIDLTSYDEVSKNAEGIYQRLLLNMPMRTTGGLWPAEWIALFKRWAVKGCEKLDRAAASYRAVRKDDVVTLTAALDQPSTLSVWLERISCEIPRVYELVREPDTTNAPIAIVTEQFPAAPNETTVTVNDANGAHTVPIT